MFGRVPLLARTTPHLDDLKNYLLGFKLGKSRGGHGGLGNLSVRKIKFV